MLLVLTLGVIGTRQVFDQVFDQVFAISFGGPRRPP
jgi:hypothetical protein